MTATAEFGETRKGVTGSLTCGSEKSRIVGITQHGIGPTCEVGNGPAAMGQPGESAGEFRRGHKGETGVMEMFDRIVREEEGQDLIEYALIAGFISVICYAVIQATGTSVSKIWDKVKTAADAAAAA